MNITMNNKAVEKILDDCEEELTNLNLTISGLSGFDAAVGYLAKYAVIKSCGSIEVAFKRIVSDYCARKTKTSQVNRFINNRVDNSSLNPSYRNMCNLLGDFDSEWKLSFMWLVDIHKDSAMIQQSLKSLNVNRNKFAHGQNLTITIASVQKHFKDARNIIEIFEYVVN